MLFFDKAHAANTIHTIIKHIPHRSGASDEPHDAPRPIQHANLRHVKQTHSRPSRSSQTPHHMPTNAPPLKACFEAAAPLQAQRCRSTASPWWLGEHARKAPLVKVRQRQSLQEMVRPLSPRRESRWNPWIAAQCSACPVDQSSSSASASQASRRAAQSRHPAIFLPSMVRKELSTRKTRDNNMLPPAGFLWGRPRGVIPRSNSALTQLFTCIQCT